MLQEIISCEVCGNKRLQNALDLGRHPMCDDLVAVGSSRICPEYPIAILFCDKCITAHQQFQIPKRELFPSSYHYRARHTADVLNGMRQLVSACEQHYGELRNKKVLDVGCNDGSLLSIFRERCALTYGIEPTGAAEDARKEGHEIDQEFISEGLAVKFVRRHGHPHVVTFTNVFAHIEDLGALIRALKLLASSETLIVIENHYFGAILEKKQFDTFYHEHPRTYSCTSFIHIAEALGMHIRKVEFPERYGGNIRVFMASSKGDALQGEILNQLYSKENDFGAKLLRLSSEIEGWKANKGAELRYEVNRHGKLPAKAFPGRSAIPVKLLGLDENMISAVYEKPQSAKLGYYVPGTRIPIRSDRELSWESNSDSPLINFAWHIGEEIKSYMHERGYRGRIIDIISNADFPHRL